MFHFETRYQPEPAAVGTASGLTQASRLIAEVGLRLAESEKYIAVVVAVEAGRGVRVVDQRRRPSVTPPA